MDSPKRLATRNANMERIKSTARELLAAKGASALSLREVAREMHQTSSALYRYFPTRDDLLTALILDSYNELGAAAEAAASKTAYEDVGSRWRATCHAIRSWAKEHPHEYALIFGSPVPNYQAPQDTIAAASRVTLALGSILAARFVDQPAPTAPTDPRYASVLEWESLEEFIPNVPRPVAARAILAWSDIFGFLSFELFGHFVGSVKDADALFALLLDDLEELLSLSSDL